MLYGQCIRLYDKEGEHIISILPCCDDEDSFDICTPEGKVWLCTKDLEYVVTCLSDLIEDINS